MISDIIKKESFLQLILDNIPIYVFWKDRNSVYLGCNKNFALVAGFNTPDQIIGKTDYEMPWSKEDSDFYRKIDKEVMDSGKAQINFEESQNVADNKTKWLSTSKVPLFDADGKVIGVLGTYEDITARKEMELQLKRQTEELQVKNDNLKEVNFKLEQANTEIEQFTSATSHDLQEPLRMIGSFSNLLERKYSYQMDEEGVEYLNYIKEGSVRMSSMVKEILSYSKLNKTQERLEPILIRELVTAAIHELNPLILSSNAKVEINLPQEKIKVQRTQIITLFVNLIANAIKFNDSKQPIVKIDFQEKNREWIGAVVDDGIGIEEQYKDYIFQPFKRLNKREEFKGNGIGLSICQRVVHVHGGKIWMEPNTGKGTTFYFTLKK